MIRIPSTLFRLDTGGGLHWYTKRAGKEGGVGDLMMMMMIKRRIMMMVVEMMSLVITMMTMMIMMVMMMMMIRRMMMVVVVVMMSLVITMMMMMMMMMMMIIMIIERDQEVPVCKICGTLRMRKRMKVKMVTTGIDGDFLKGEK